MYCQRVRLIFSQHSRNFEKLWFQSRFDLFKNRNISLYSYIVSGTVSPLSSLCSSFSVSHSVCLSVVSPQ